MLHLKKVATESAQVQKRVTGTIKVQYILISHKLISHDLVPNGK